MVSWVRCIDSSSLPSFLLYSPSQQYFSHVGMREREREEWEINGFFIKKFKDNHSLPDLQPKKLDRVRETSPQQTLTRILTSSSHYVVRH